MNGIASWDTLIKLKEKKEGRMEEHLVDQLDPRVHGELERLNEASKVINTLENKLSENRNRYRTALSESTTQLNDLLKKLGDCVTKARPYYDAKKSAKEAQFETHLAAVRFERAVSMHGAAREMVAVAEQGMENDVETTDTAWQEMLNHATVKVNEAELERFASGVEHQEKMEVFKKAEINTNTLQKKLKFNIYKSRKYFELNEKTQFLLQSLVNRVNSAEGQLIEAKTEYSQALRSLETISNSIHKARKALGERGTGVGAEDEPQVLDPIPNEPTESLNPVYIEKSTSIIPTPSPPTKRLSPTVQKKTNELLLSVADLNQVHIS